MAPIPIQLRRESMTPQEQEEQQKTPYLDALRVYVEKQTIPFHVPGHKQGRGMHAKFRSFLNHDYLLMDLTEVPGLDNLSQPTEVLKEAQILAAKAYGVDFTYFLVNGSSSGNHAMLMAVCNPGDVVLIPRNAHKSVFASLIFSGVVPVYMMPEFDETLKMDHTVTAETLQESLSKHPEAKAVMLISPTYYGVAADMKTLVRIIHEHGKIAIVDEAWGPHFHFHPRLPLSAADAEADLVVNSTHKLLSSLTQSSMLHFSGNRVDRGRLEAVLRLFLTSSPSCLLLASMDATRMQMATEGEILLERVIQLAESARRRINQMDHLTCMGREIVGRPGVYDLDPTRLVISSNGLGYTGYEMEELLRRNDQVQVEFSDLFHVVALVTLGDREEEIDALVKGLERSAKTPPVQPRQFLLQKEIKLPDWPVLRMTPREAFVASHEAVPMEKAAGRVSTELITTYPPGIPAIAPGEEFTKEIVEYLRIEREAGSRITGVADSMMRTVRVVR